MLRAAPVFSTGPCFEFGHLEDRGIWRQSVLVCTVEEAYRNNLRFTAISGHEHYTLAHGLRIISDPMQWDTVDTFYRTRYGPCVAHSGVIFSKDDRSFGLAFRRLDCVRKPDVPGYEQWLTGMQERFFLEIMPAHLQRLASLYAPHFSGYMGMEREARAHYADPHPKRALRIRAFEQALRSGHLLYKHWVPDHKALVEVKMKPEEFAKPGKKARCIGDLGVMLSLQGFRLTEMLKQAQSGEVYAFAGGIAQFVKDPSPDTLRQVFRDLIDPPGKFYYVYFSDDACFSVRTPTGVKVYNLDISCCDGSHGPKVFEALKAVVPVDCQADMQILLDQCKLPVLLRSCHHNTKRKGSTRGVRIRIKLRTNRYTLFSGSTITTAINNIANLSIAVALSTYGATSPSEIEMAANLAGYIVTVDTCSKPEDIQFLKHSPALDVDGCYQPLLNLGVLLRASGTIKRDLPGKGDWKRRAARAQASLIACTYPGVEAPFLHTARKAYPTACENATAAYLREFAEKTRASYGRFSDESFTARYAFSGAECQELHRFFSSPPGTMYGSEAFSRVLEKDYALTCVRWNQILPPRRVTLPNTPQAC